MPVWQYDLDSLPRAKVVAVCGSAPERLENEVDAATGGLVAGSGNPTRLPANTRRVYGHNMDISQKGSWSRDLYHLW
jgi:hypothetical protein